jgi:hypothetical protein
MTRRDEAGFCVAAERVLPGHRSTRRRRRPSQLGRSRLDAVLIQRSRRGLAPPSAAVIRACRDDGATAGSNPGTTMSESTPDDLATFFRSVPRRLRGAIGDAEPSSVAGLMSELEAHIDTQTLIGVPADPAAMASAISDRPADAWNETTLDTLRREALAAGRVLRRIGEVTGADADDD